MLLQLGPFGLRMLPLVLLAAVVVGARLTAGELRRRGLDPALADDLLVPAGLAGLVGARLLHVLVFDPAWYLGHPWDLLSVWSGGLAFPGALLGGVMVARGFCVRRSVSFWRLADAAAPALLVGYALGALGTFLHGSSYGIPTDLPWAVVFSDPRGQAPLGIPLHPTQLYAALAAFVLFGGLQLVRRRPRADGVVFLLALAALSAVACLDLLVGDALWLADAVPAGPVFSVAILGGAGLLRARPGSRPSGAGVPAPVPPR